MTVDYDEQNRRATVAVADDGAGVPSSYKRKVFEPYFSTKNPEPVWVWLLSVPLFRIIMARSV